MYYETSKERIGDMMQAIREHTFNMPIEHKASVTLDLKRKVMIIDNSYTKSIIDTGKYLELDTLGDVSSMLSDTY